MGLNMLDWQTINDLCRECGAKDRPMLSSYLRHSTSEREARKTIGILGRTHPAIWQRRVTPPQMYESRL